MTRAVEGDADSGVDCMLRYGVNKCFDIMDAGLISQLREFLESEARSCSMDFGCITPEYVYKMWGGSISIEEIENGLKELRKQGLPLLLK
jgi:hypothetical protein